MAKVKVPKRVAGVKVPKKLRKQTKRALKMVDNGAARDLALAGLALAAESMIDRGQSRTTAKKAAGELLKQASGGGKQLRQAMKHGLDGLDLGEVLREAAAEAARRFLEGFEEGHKQARKSVKPAGAKRRRSSGRSAASAAAD